MEAVRIRFSALITMRVSRWPVLFSLLKKPEPDGLAVSDIITALYYVWGDVVVKLGTERMFAFRGNDGVICHAFGKVVAVGCMTMDGLRVVEVQFIDRVRKFSADHLAASL